MPATAITELDYRPSYLAAAATGAAVFLIYLLTLAPSTAMWDTSEYIAAAYVVGLPHPPGNPLFVLLGRVFALLPIAPNVAMRINILAAVTSAATAAMWFLVTERVLVSWLESRWQRIVGGVLGALVGATAFTVWNQSVVNEKVYTISLFGLAVISWLTVRWSDDPEGPKADRILVVIAYLLGLGYTNHMMGMLAAPAVAVAVLIRRPDTLLRWRLLLACGAVMFLGMTVFATQPIRAGFFPAINEGEPTTWDSFWYNFNRGQYGKPSVMERQAPFSAQIGMWWLYFRWQWMRDMHGIFPGWQSLLASFYLILGLLGGYVHWKRDRRSFWYFGTFMLTLTVLLIFYLNFKYGYSQAPSLGDSVAREVRDRDYFFLVSFSAWGVWAALGLVFIWESLAAMIGSHTVKMGRDTLELPTRRGWMLAAPVLVLAILPLVGNWNAASRRGHTATRDFAYDLLNSVEPYGILVTVGDNDTFPLWYAQEVEGIRKDVIVANTSLLNTDWYVRQMLRRPVFEYDAANGPSIYRGKSWPKPNGPPMKLTIEQADSIPLSYQVAQPQTFRKAGTDIVATIPPQYLSKADLIVLRMIVDAYPDRPVYFSRTSGNYADAQLGLRDFLLQQGLARKLVPKEPTAGTDTMPMPGEGWLDVSRSIALWDSVYLAPEAIIREGRWVDRASNGIAMLYIVNAVILAEAEERRGHAAKSRELLESARGIARVLGIESALQLPAPPPVPAEPQGLPIPLPPAETGKGQ
ncbi:MAG TPA: DUF2723 domain-containing protein [Gemmatimonadaceae bacterium]|nr:DUF2723 domain-containing protein [Gemmatimonadaceae bacterium]